MSLQICRNQSPCLHLYAHVQLKMFSPPPHTSALSRWSLILCCNRAAIAAPATGPSKWLCLFRKYFSLSCTLDALKDMPGRSCSTRS